jgi:PAS domain S-box-containing protein
MNDFIDDNISLWQWNIDSGEIFINSQWAQMLGYSQSELEPLTIDSLQQLIHPEDIESSKQATQNHLDGITPIYSSEVRLRHKNGEWIWVYSYGKIETINRQNSPLWITGYSQAITKWKNTEAAFKSNQVLLHNIINEMPDVFVLKDEKGDFLLCNETVAKLYKTTPNQMVGKSDEDFGVPKELSDFFRQNVLAIMQKGETELVYEDSFDAKTGEVHHFRSIKKPLKDHTGKNQILVIAQDITEIVEANEKIAKNEKRLNEVFEATQEGIWDWNVSTGKVHHNSQWYKILGFEQNELSNNVEAFSAQIHPEDKPLVWERLQNLFSPGVDSYYSEHRMICKNGQTI